MCPFHSGETDTASQQLPPQMPGYENLHRGGISSVESGHDSQKYCRSVRFLTLECLPESPHRIPGDSGQQWEDRRSTGHGSSQIVVGFGARER